MNRGLRAGQRLKGKENEKEQDREMTESKPIDDAKAMEVIESDVNSLFFRTEEHSSGSPGSSGSKRGPDNIIETTNQTVR